MAVVETKENKEEAVLTDDAQKTRTPRAEQRRDGRLMDAVRIERFGDPSELRFGEALRPAIAAGEVLVEVRAAAVEHSDVKNVQGAMPHTTLPRVPGRGFAGIVVEGPRQLVDAEVWGAGGGDLGFTRDGSHARYLAVPRAAVLPKPASLSLEEAAASGVGYVTAGAALFELGALTAEMTVMVTGAAGSVGSAAVRIARWKGARVIGAIRDDSEQETAERGGVEAVVDTSREDLPEAVMAATEGKGADLLLDTVGGVLFEPSLASLAPRGRMVAITTTGERRVSFDLFDFFRKELRLLGLNTLKLDAERCARILEALTPGFEAGNLHAPPIAERYPLEEARTAYARVSTGEVPGKVLLVAERAGDGSAGALT
jgi:NADPH:quinone reductase-like Zn-dependent oxidoreductase